MPEKPKMDRNLALEVVRVTEAAALSASRLMGRGDEKAADQAAVDAMRTALNSLYIDGTVVIGEGERDEAPMLYIGEKVGQGKGGPAIDIALDPLEGTTITAKGGMNALTKSLALDYAKYGIRVNAVCPAGTWTPMLRKWCAEQPDPGSIERYLDEIHPLGYCPEGDVIADPCVFLISDQARFITGHIMHVSGGAELCYRRPL